MYTDTVRCYSHLGKRQHYAAWFSLGSVLIDARLQSILESNECEQHSRRVGWPCKRLNFAVKQAEKICLVTKFLLRLGPPIFCSLQHFVLDPATLMRSMHMVQDECFLTQWPGHSSHTDSRAHATRAIGDDDVGSTEVCFICAKLWTLTSSFGI